VRALITKADQGDTQAMKRLANHYFYADDESSGVHWTQRAADAGDAQAEYDMYYFLASSQVTRDKERAIEYLQRSAEHGYTSAQETLGTAYLRGVGVPKDEGRARFWLRKSALSGDLAGFQTLCDLALQRNDLAQCEECLRLSNDLLAKLHPNSFTAKEVLRQRALILERLKTRQHSAHEHTGAGP
jgi:TPR repeat protein